METEATARRDLAAAARFWGVGLAVVALAAACYVGAQILLLAFAGVLFGVALRGAAVWLARRTHLPITAALAVCVAVVAAVGVALALWVVPRVLAQSHELGTRLSAASDDLRAQLRRTEATRGLADDTFDGIGWLRAHATQAASVLMTTVGALSASVFVAFVALYVAFAPRVYRDGVLRLLPPRRRDRGGAVLDALAGALRRWLLARAVSMTAVGVATTLGLWALGIPLPVTLGLLAGVLGFVPNIGPLVSAVPALLLALTVDPAHVAYVGALYLAINLGDGYVLTPALQQRAVQTPPALILTGQLLLGALWGVVGLTFATPLVACATVVVRMTYVEDLLEGDP